MSVVKVAACSYEGSLFGWDICEEEQDLGNNNSDNSDEEEDDGDSKDPSLNAKLSFGFNVTTQVYSIKAFIAISRDYISYLYILCPYN